MHASQLLHDWVSDVLSGVHSKLQEAVTAAISGALDGGRLTVTALGRSIPGTAKEKHRIKRADRLLSNENLGRARQGIYAQLTRRILGEQPRPLVLIDWSDLDKAQTLFLLRASTPAGGRSLTLYEEVHTLKAKEKPQTHKRFLKNLQCLLPEGCQPIVVTDAGFRSPWFREVQRLGWDWVGRIRNRDQCQLGPDEPWISCKALYSRAARTPKDIGEALLTARNALRCRMVLYKAKAKGRKNLTRRGNKPAQSIKSQRNAASNREPWLLATSLPVDAWSAKRIVKIYAARMQIEEAFRDLKNTRCGLSLELSGTSRADRLANLVLIGSLTATFAWLVGKATELAGQHRQFQANSTKHFTVLSAVFIGIRAFKDRSIRFATSLFELAHAHLKSSVTSYAEQY